MTEAMLEAILAEAAFKKSEGNELRAEDARKLTVYVSQGSASLTVARVEGLTRNAGMIVLRNDKGERYFVGLDNVFAIAVEPGASATTTRKAGFLT